MKKSILSRALNQLTGDWTVFVEDAVPGTELSSHMHEASIPSFGFFFMLSLAAVIATLGLIANSAPSIIGAMIVAPLMSPIMSFAFGAVAFDRVLVLRSIITVIAGVILVVALSFLITHLFGMRITGSEILNRTSPTLIDLGVAVAAGAAAAFAHTRKSIISSIAGVAIAVALVPPLAVTGIGLDLGRKATAEAGLSLSKFGLHAGGTDIAAGSFLLFLTNFFGIVVFAMLVFIFQRYGKWKKALIGLVLLVGISTVLINPLYQALEDLYVKNRVVRLFAKLAVTRPDIITGRVKINSIRVTHQGGVTHVNIDGIFPKDEYTERAAVSIEKRADMFREHLEADIGRPVKLDVDIIAADMRRYSSHHSEPQTDENQAVSE